MVVYHGARPFAVPPGLLDLVNLCRAHAPALVTCADSAIQARALVEAVDVLADDAVRDEYARNLVD